MSRNCFQFPGEVKDSSVFQRVCTRNWVHPAS